MKTREEFLLLADAYKAELWRRAFLFVPIVVLAFIAINSISGPKRGALNLVCLMMMVCFNLYLIKANESIARKLELVCLSCSRALHKTDLKQVTATQACPHCRQPLFS
jgi:DNA-directed RNA polymerase subunit RPC12/RpoP